jgi:hypothetical protein
MLITSRVYGETFSKKDFSLALGVQANSLLYKRGIVTYGGHQVSPLLSVTLFNPNFLFAGSALYYKYHLNQENFILRSRLNINATPDQPLYYTNEQEGKRVKRDSTSELDLYLEYKDEKNIYLRLQSSTDLVASHGQYFESFIHLPLFNFSSGPNKDSLLLLGLFTALGYGDLNHNEYLYGEEAQGWSINNVEYGLSLRSPKVIDMFWPTFKITRFEILGNKNRNASYVDEKEGWSIEALVAFKAW